MYFLRRIVGQFVKDLSFVNRKITGDSLAIEVSL